MPKNAFPQTRRDAPSASKSKDDAADHTPYFVVFRETIESIVVAFVLAFLFRTFEAEAFVIPTGSMSPSLQGRHKDVICSQCGYRFRTSASSEDPEEIGRPGSFFRTFDEAEVVAGMCPMCRYPMPYTAALPSQALDDVERLADIKSVKTLYSYPGDRILVNKYGYDFGDPKRWDVVVFKFPGDGEMNYIKRLVGLPGEELDLYQGDVFTRPLDDKNAQFQVQHKPPEKVAAMLQTVHDTDYESATLYKGRWPLRWAATTPDGWKVDATPGDKTVALKFTVDGSAGQPTAWLRYRHIVPHSDNWAPAIALATSGSVADLAAREHVTEQQALADIEASKTPQLITDFNSYNARIHRLNLERGQSWLSAMDSYLGYNWVGDLAVDADVHVEEARGELALDLVEAGYHFRTTIDLKSGDAKLTIIDGRTGKALPFEDSAKTSISSPGKYKVRFANVDDQLLLWVDGKLVEFQKNIYDPDALFPEKRAGMIPWAGGDGQSDQGDLAPAGIGATDAKITISRLAVLRDVYYIATNEKLMFQNRNEGMIMDYESPSLPARAGGQQIRALRSAHDLFTQPEAWPRFLTRRHVQFPVSPAQLFVMGDNSPESADCRLWAGNSGSRGVPGGSYLDRRLLIGKADCVFWPHSWGSIPGLPQLPGFPNFKDMRLVR